MVFDNANPFHPPLGDIFAINLPPEEAAVLLTMYSRSDLRMRDLYQQHRDRADSDPKAFFGRVLDTYGDQSVAQNASAAIGVEDVSLLAALMFFHQRAGVAGIQTSSRYRTFKRDRDTKWYPYFRGLPDSISKNHKKMYHIHMDNLFRMYHAAYKRNVAELRTEYPQPDTMSDATHARIIRAAALDRVRFLLPLGTLTAFGMNLTGQAASHIYNHLEAYRRQGSHEMEWVAPAFRNAAGYMLGSVFGRHEESRDQIIDYMVKTAEWFNMGKIVDTKHYPNPYAILQSASSTLSAVHRYITPFSASSDRPSRFCKAHRDWEKIQLNYTIGSTIAGATDLLRHRYASPFNRFDVIGSLVVPGVPELQEACENAFLLYEVLAEEIGEINALLCLPVGTMIKWDWVLNARALSFIAELRTQRQGHPEYRDILLQMVNTFDKDIIDHLNSGITGNVNHAIQHNIRNHLFKFVDTREPEYGLSREDYEVRLAEKGVDPL